jgi:cobalt-precorrin-7 (C5)-methyltransferase
MGAERALKLFQEDIKGETYTLNANLNDIIQRTLRSVQEGRSVALLSTGDPTFFGLLKPVLESSTDLELEIVPGISSLQICTSRLQICLEEVGLILSFHGQPDAEKHRLVEAVRDGKVVIILPDPEAFQPDQIAKYLIDSGIDPKTPSAVCENLSYDNERIREADLQAISSENFGTMCVMVVGTWTRRKLRKPAY